MARNRSASLVAATCVATYGAACFSAVLPQWPVTT
jgi:hypothetical protein